MSGPVQMTLEGLAGRLLEEAQTGRRLIALAGPPGSGKSTLSVQLADLLNQGDPGSAAVMPMDGFHLDDQVLAELGLSSRKGAPETFDVAGLEHMLVRLKRNEARWIAVPLFNRKTETAHAAARLVPQSARFVVVEGNYLLLDHPDWQRIPACFDVTAMLVTPEATLRARLEERWTGLGYAPEEVRRKVDGNDLVNVRLVQAESRDPQYVIAS